MVIIKDLERGKGIGERGFQGPFPCISEKVKSQVGLFENGFT